MANSYNTESGWTGWIVFASVMLGLVGFFHIIEGIAALISNNLAFISPNAVWVLNVSAWGWLHIVGGAILVTAAGSLLTGSMFGRIVAIIAAVISALANMAFLPYYPVWSILMIVIDVMVIYAVTVYGGELREA